jgi:hypothetical protein
MRWLVTIGFADHDHYDGHDFDVTKLSLTM